MNRIFTLALICVATVVNGLAITDEKIGEFQRVYPHRSEMDVGEFVGHVNSWQRHVATELGVADGFRKVRVSAVEALLAATKGHPTRLLMRHGEQQPSDRIGALQSEPMRKIAMMRERDNRNNPLTDRSLVELFATALVLDFVALKNEFKWRVESSTNRRAEQVADGIAYATHCKVSEQERWNCVNYPEENALPTMALLAQLPNGSLPWEKQVVDVIVGPGTFDRIQHDVADAVEGHDGYVISVSHTQQTNAACEQLNLPSKRLTNYGFILIGSEPQLFDNGVF